MKNKIFMFMVFTFVMMLSYTYNVDAKVTDKGYTLYINGVKATDNMILEDYVITYTIKDSKGNHVNIGYIGDRGNRPRYSRFFANSFLGKTIGDVNSISCVTESGEKLNFSFHLKFCIDFFAVSIYNKYTNTNIPEILLRKFDYNNDIILSKSIMQNLIPDYEDIGVYSMSNNIDCSCDLEFKLYEDSKCTKEISNVSDYVWAKKKKNGYWYFTEIEGICTKDKPCKLFIRFRMYDSIVGKNSTPFIIADDDVEYYEELLRIMEKIRES